MRQVTIEGSKGGYVSSSNIERNVDFFMKKTVKGYVTSVPVDAKQSRIAISQDAIEYRILPKAAGVDLEDEINATVEVTGDLSVEDDVHYLTARVYKVLDDAAWDEDDQ